MDFDLKDVETRVVYNLLIGLVAPRPIALVTSAGQDGVVNAAPFSAYNYLCTDPPVVGLGVTDRPGGGFIPKDTARNIRQGGEFVVNVVTSDLAERMNVCDIAFPPGVSEIVEAGFTTEPSRLVKVPRIREAHAALECVEHTTLEIGRSRIILGRVISIFVEDRFVDPAGPYIRAEELHAIGRMNGQGAYVHTEGAFFHMPRIPLKDWEERKRESQGEPS